MTHDVFISHSSLDQLAADYSNVFWRRGGVNAWTASGEPTTNKSGGGQ